MERQSGRHGQGRTGRWGRSLQGLWEPVSNVQVKGTENQGTFISKDIEKENRTDRKMLGQRSLSPTLKFSLGPCHF